MPRAGLNRHVVAAEAARIADGLGPDRLTLSAVAEALGVAPPSLYKHVDGVGALRRDVAVLALGELAQRLSRAAAGRSGGEALAAISHAYRDYARRHPGRYSATLRAPDQADADHAAAGDAALEIVYAVLAGYGIDGDDAVDATRAWRSLLHGFVALEAGGGFGLPRGIDASFDRLVRAFDAMLGDWRSLATDHRAPV